MSHTLVFIVDWFARWIWLTCIDAVYQHKCVELTVKHVSWCSVGISWNWILIKIRQLIKDGLTSHHFKWHRLRWTFWWFSRLSICCSNEAEGQNSQGTPPHFSCLKHRANELPKQPIKLTRKIWQLFPVFRIPPRTNVIAKLKNKPEK